MSIVGTVGRAPKEFWGAAVAINSSPSPGSSNGGGAGFLVPFSVEGLSGPIEVAEVVDETTPLVRVWWSFKGQDAARGQGRIVEVADTPGLHFAWKWYNFVADEWQWIGQDVDGGNGPVLALNEVGDVRGRYVNVSPDVLLLDEVLLGLFLVIL